MTSVCKPADAIADQLRRVVGRLALVLVLDALALPALRWLLPAFMVATLGLGAARS